MDRTKAGGVTLVFLLLAVFICFEAWQVPVGSLRMPGAGFFPLLLGVTLGVLSLLLLGTSLLGAGSDAIDVRPERREVVQLTASIFVAVFLFERAGFLLTMALFVAVVMKILGTMSWATAIVFAVLGSVVAYVVFGRVLLIALPSGILPL
jgi:putative tricarboxylic transport membrane protein